MRKWRPISAVLMSCLWVFGGLMFDEDVIVLFGSGFCLLWFGLAVARFKEFNIPKYFELLAALIGIITLSLILSFDRYETLKWLIMTISGALLWVASFNFRKVKGFSETVIQSVFLAGVIMTFLWVGHSTFGWLKEWYGPSSLIVESSSYKNHNHLADWWMVMLIMALPSFKWHWLLPGMAMLWAGKSRSADLGLLLGLGYAGWANGWLNSHKRLMKLGLAAGCLLFLIASMGKLTLSGRDFYIQTIAGLVKYPSGVGYGNFEVISSDESTHWFQRNDFSVLTHNLPLEWIAGMGWFGLVGFVWLGLVTWRMGEIPSSNSSGKTIMWRAVYWGLLINFLLDTTYFVPSMWWLFMVVMGLGEERE